MAFIFFTHLLPTGIIDFFVNYKLFMEKSEGALGLSVAYRLISCLHALCTFDANLLQMPIIALECRNVYICKNE